MSNDSLLGCAARLREAERIAQVAMEHFSQRNERYRDLIERTAQCYDPHPDVLETVRIEAVAAYEALLDAEKVKHDLAVRLARLRIGIRRLGGPGTGKANA